MPKPPNLMSLRHALPKLNAHGNTVSRAQVSGMVKSLKAKGYTSQQAHARVNGVLTNLSLHSSAKFFKQRGEVHSLREHIQKTAQSAPWVAKHPTHTPKPVLKHVTHTISAAGKAPVHQSVTHNNTNRKRDGHGRFAGS
jgi:hypothetical protein